MPKTALSTILECLPPLSEDVIASFCGARNFQKVRNYIDDGVRSWRHLSTTYHLSVAATVSSVSGDWVKHHVTVHFSEEGPDSAQCTACRFG